MARKDGKRIDTERMRDGDGTYVVVEFRMEVHDYSSGRATKYWAECDSIPGWRTERKPSLDEVAKLARESIAQHKTVKWEQKLQVGFMGEPRWRSDSYLDVPSKWAERKMEDVSFELELRINPYSYGIVAGKPMHRRNKDKHAQAGEIGAIYSNGGNLSTSTIDDTPENRAALNVILKAFVDLSAKMTKLLGAGEAQKVLTAIAAGQPLLLTGPPAPEKTGKKVTYAKKR